MPPLKADKITSEGVKSVGGFFRAFDIAFFMPGAIVLVALWWWKRIPGGRPQEAWALLAGGSEARGWLLGLVLVLALVVAAFVAGLACHGVARILHALAVWTGDQTDKHRYTQLATALFEPPPPAPPSTSWWPFDRRGASARGYEREASELSLYLWNLSSLGWNLAVALLSVPVIRWKYDALVLPWLLGALLICMLGSDFRAWSVALGHRRG